MKNILFLIIFLSGTMNLSAQERVEASLNASVLSLNLATNNGVTRDASVAGGGSGAIRFWLTPNHGVEFNYGHANDPQQATINGTKISLKAGVHEVSGAYIFRLRPSPRVQPFFGAGVALLQFNPKKDQQFNPVPQSQNKPGLLYTAGVDYMFNPHFGMRVQFRGLVFAAPSFIVEAFRSNTMHQMSEPTVGFVYRF
jgi:outer membrane protein W